jgi:hypothetical protein
VPPRTVGRQLLGALFGLRGAGLLALRAGRRPPRWREPPFESIGQGGQRQLRVRHQPQVDRVVLGDLVGVQVDVDRPGARRPDVPQLREHFGQDVGADHQVHIAGPGDRQALRREHVAGLAAPERVIVREVQLAAVGAPDVRPEQLGESRQLRLGAGPGDAVADVEGRAGGLGQHRRGSLDELRGR